MKILYTYTDGGCSGNWNQDYSKRQMVWVATDQFGDIIFDRNGNGGSNNIAELLAIRDVVEHAVQNHYDAVCITSDSAVACIWVNGALLNEKVRIGKHINDPERTREVIDDIIEFSRVIPIFLRWRPREENLAGQYIEDKFSL